MLQYLLFITEDAYVPQIERLYNRFHDEMIRIGRYQLKRAGDYNYYSDAEDVVQASFLKISKYVHKINFDKSEKELKAYVFKILSNEVNNFLNDKSDCESIDDHLDHLSDDEFFQRFELQEEYNEVVGAIKALDVKYSTVMLCYYHDNMKVKDIAELMGLPEKTIYTRLERGKCLLLMKLERV